MANLFGDDFFDEESDNAKGFSHEKSAEVIDFSALTPATNSFFWGHRNAESVLRHDAETGCLPQALILSGPTGIGKATLAYRLARFLLAFPNAPSPTEGLFVPPSHPVFRRVAAGGHADLLTIGRAYDERKEKWKEEIAVDDVRRIAPFLRRTAAEGGWRIVIVDSAEYLNRSGQNALLKILEEPPTRSMFILTCAQVGTLLPTVRSRCRTLTLAPLTSVEMTTALQVALPNLSLHQRQALDAIAAGSLGRALSMHNGGGMDVAADMSRMLTPLSQLNWPDIHAWVEKTARLDTDFAQAAELFIAWTTEKARTTALQRQVAANNPLAGVSWTSAEAFTVWEKMTALFRQTENYTLDRRQALFHAFLLLQKPDHPGLNI